MNRNSVFSVLKCSILFLSLSAVMNCSSYSLVLVINSHQLNIIGNYLISTDKSAVLIFLPNIEYCYICAILLHPDLKLSLSTSRIDGEK